MTKLDNSAAEALRGGNFHPAGHWEISVNGGPWEIDPNLVVNEGIMHFLTTTLDQGTQNAAFYIALFSGAVTPAAGWTAANFTATATEFTNYDETTRVVWANDAAASNSIGNDATPAVFTIATGGGTIRGAALMSASGKSTTTGVLIAATRFATDKVMDAGSELRIKYVVAGSSS